MADVKGQMKMVVYNDCGDLEGYVKTDIYERDVNQQSVFTV